MHFLYVDSKEITLQGTNGSALIKQANKNIKNFSILFLLGIQHMKSYYNSIIDIKCKPVFVKDESGRDIPLGNDIYISIVNNKAHDTTSNRCKTNKECKILQETLDEKINLYNSFYYFDKKQIQGEKEAIENCKKDTKCAESIDYDMLEKISFFDQLIDITYYNIEIKIGKNIFTVHNITDTIFNDDYTFIGLVVNDKQVSFYLNTQIYNFSLDEANDLILSEDVFKINDDANIDMALYSFAFYADALCDTDIHIFKMYNYYYMFGSNKIEEDKQTFIQYNNELKKQIENRR